jgi:RHS repeat-associated protein
LRINGNQSEEAGGGTALKHLFGGKEFQGVMGLQWYDFGARMLDPVIGRWFVLDPEAEKYPDVTPYGYALNNPIRYMNLDGRDIYSDPGDVFDPGFDVEEEIYGQTMGGRPGAGTQVDGC